MKARIVFLRTMCGVVMIAGALLTFYVKHIQPEHIPPILWGCLGISGFAFLVYSFLEEIFILSVFAAALSVAFIAGSLNALL